MNVDLTQVPDVNFLLFFAGMFLSISALLALLSGWWWLAVRYASARPVKGENFRFRCGAVGWGVLSVHYGFCLFGTVGPDALVLKPFFRFAFLLPRLVIPWSEIESCEEAIFFLFPCIKIRVGGFIGSIRLYGSFGRAVLAAWRTARQAG